MNRASIRITAILKLGVGFAGPGLDGGLKDWRNLLNPAAILGGRIDDFRDREQQTRN